MTRQEMARVESEPAFQAASQAVSERYRSLLDFVGDRNPDTFTGDTLAQFEALGHAWEEASARYDALTLG